MRALSVRQPWAWAILHCEKDVENRSWATDYRGPLVIHTGKRPADRDAVAVLEERGYEVPTELPTGAFLGVVKLRGCTRYSGSHWGEPGQWHWCLAHPQPFEDPVPGRGQLGLWFPPMDVQRLAKDPGA